jgi:hypothetical protein
VKDIGPTASVDDSENNNGSQVQNSVSKALSHKNESKETV